MTSFMAFVAQVQETIIDPIITVVALAAFILFAYGLVTFIRSSDNEEKRKTGQQHMIWGIIGLVILFGARTIVLILTKILGVPPPGTAPTPPASSVPPAGTFPPQ